MKKNHNVLAITDASTRKVPLRAVFSGFTLSDFRARVEIN